MLERSPTRRGEYEHASGVEVDYREAWDGLECLAEGGRLGGEDVAVFVGRSWIDHHQSRSVQIRSVYCRRGEDWVVQDGRAYDVLDALVRRNCLAVITPSPLECLCEVHAGLIRSSELVERLDTALRHHWSLSVTPTLGV